MKEVTLESVKQWHEIMDNFRSNANKYRGQSVVDWKLIPKAGRKEYIIENDQLIFKQWKRRATFYLKHQNLNDWELLSIAQHTGLPTRLLDWSHNPLVALFFCCFENFEKDGCVFIFPPKEYVLTENTDPFNIKADVLFYQPNTSNERLANQYAYFSIHKNPRVEYLPSSKSGELVRLVIKKELKKDFLLMLNQYGINFLTLFPDLEGLSKHLSWFYQQAGLKNNLLYSE
jgi:hypothetical protein